jgi:outer membrane murein-binding lipoprotein Lpp
MKNFVMYFVRKRLLVLNLVLVLAVAVGSLYVSGCESKSAAFKAKVTKALAKADTISVYGISNDQSGRHEILRKSMLKDSAEFNAAVEALTNANANGTLSQVPFETIVYITADDKVLMKLFYCLVDGRYAESEDQQDGILIIPWEFRTNIRSNR